MTGFSRRVPLHFLIYGLYELKFWLNHTSPYNISRFKFRNIMEKLTFDHRTTYLPFTFLWNNDGVQSVPTFALPHLWVIWVEIFTQPPQSIYYVEKKVWEPLGEVDFWPPNHRTANSYPLLFSEIMMGFSRRTHFYFLISGPYELKFCVNHPSPYNIWGFKFQNLWVKLTFDHRPTEQPTANFYFSLR